MKKTILVVVVGLLLTGCGKESKNVFEVITNCNDGNLSLEISYIDKETKNLVFSYNYLEKTCEKSLYQRQKIKNNIVYISGIEKCSKHCMVHMEKAGIKKVVFLDTNETIKIKKNGEKK